MTLKTAGSRTVTATDVAAAILTAGTSASVTVSAGAATQAPGAAAGRDRRAGHGRPARPGTPTAVTAGAAVTVTVNAVDANWNIVASATPVVTITSSDPNADPAGR